ncbi:Trm112 family protein, partial [Candidatus Hadarchaeum sp.]|uniref:Trm112 family protein n=1 Tax=Candidatus Hadarchaeum sp. TaxID=2883567 RepID=UPI00319E34B1
MDRAASHFSSSVTFRVRIMKRELMEILACPVCKSYPLELHVFEEGQEIVEGMLICPKCSRWYPIVEEI